MKTYTFKTTFFQKNYISKLKTDISQRMLDTQKLYLDINITSTEKQEFVLQKNFNTIYLLF